MSTIKRQLEEREELRGSAVDILCQARALEECEWHPGTYFEGPGEVEQAYMLANALISKGELDLPRGMSRREFTDIVKQVHDDNSGVCECSSCEKIMRE